MTRFGYLGALVISLAGLAVLDRRFALAFWDDARRTAWCLLIGVAGFLGWDLLGLGLGIFARGDSPHQTGLLLAPELPVEEAFFLALLCYTALLTWRWLDLRVGRRAAAAPPRAHGTPDGAADRGGTP